MQTSVQRCLLIGVILSGSYLFIQIPGQAARADDSLTTKIIFDTDISGDVDDVLALAMLHALADREHCELLAVTISKVNPLTGPFTDAVNTFYGRPDLPIGVTRDAQRRRSKYLKLALEQDKLAARYPHDIHSNEELPEAVALLRKTLANEPDHSVVIVQVGLAVNVARLLQSGPDDASPLAGIELVRKKVKRLSVMAGAFETINGDDHYLEANVRNDVPSMQTLAEMWPNEVPVIWSGFEIGIAVPYPRRSIHLDFEYVAQHIVKEAYLLHSGPNHDRPTWDLTSVLEAVFPERDYFELSGTGNVTIEDDGFVAFTPSGEGRDRFLILAPEKRSRVVEALTLLTSQPPVRRAD